MSSRKDTPLASLIRGATMQSGESERPRKRPFLDLKYACSKDILSRWTFPLVPDDNHPGGHSYEHLRGNKYIAKGNSVSLSRCALLFYSHDPAFMTSRLQNMQDWPEYPHRRQYDYLRQRVHPILRHRPQLHHLTKCRPQECVYIRWDVRW